MKNGRTDIIDSCFERISTNIQIILSELDEENVHFSPHAAQTRARSSALSVEKNLAAVHAVAKMLDLVIAVNLTDACKIAKRMARANSFGKIQHCAESISAIVNGCVLDRASQSNYSIRGAVAQRNDRKPIRALKILAAFACLCGKENRENIECIVADLKKDAAKMRREKRREWFIQCVLLWHAFPKTILPIIWDKICRLLAATLAIEEIIRKIKGH